MKTPVNRIRELRKQRGWSQAELADKAGLQSVGHVSNLETGGRTSAAAFIAIARALGVPFEELGVTLDAHDESNAFAVGQPHYRLPVRARIVCGPADEAVEYLDSPIDWEWSDEGPRDNCEIIEVFGDSMEPVFMEGDRIVIKMSESPVDGDVVLAEFIPDEDEPRQMTVKVFRKADRIAMLEPLNVRKYRTVVMDNRWKIVGVMVKHIRRNVRGFHRRS